MYEIEELCLPIQPEVSLFNLIQAFPENRCLLLSETRDAWLCFAAQSIHFGWDYMQAAPTRWVPVQTTQAPDWRRPWTNTIDGYIGGSGAFICWAPWQRLPPTLWVKNYQKSLYEPVFGNYAFQAIHHINALITCSTEVTFASDCGTLCVRLSVRRNVYL